LIGAIYVDNSRVEEGNDSSGGKVKAASLEEMEGYRYCSAFIRGVYDKHFDYQDLGKEDLDYKGQLIQYVAKKKRQEKGSTTPWRTIKSEYCKVDPADLVGSGIEKSSKGSKAAAEQIAAMKTLKSLGVIGGDE
jgi:hypothetical protein